METENACVGRALAKALLQEALGHMKQSFIAAVTKQELRDQSTSDN
jgi:hypothetical protein